MSRPWRNTLAAAARLGLAAGHRLAHRAGLAPASAPVAYVAEAANWSTLWDGRYYAAAVEAVRPGTVAVTTRPERLVGRVAHFGSQFQWQLWDRAVAAANRVVVTYFHGRPEDGPEMAAHVAYFLDRLGAVERVVTAAGLVERRLLGWGVPRERLVRVPLGVDTALFRPADADGKAAARRRLGVPDGALCLGSFQKDGVGWGDGLEPKAIKGPDLFVEAAARLRREVPLFVLLTGPARGYVRRGLERHGVPYAHAFLEDYRAIVGHYHALDLYLATSRDEGGPKALLESLATGVPVVTTRVGMAEDVIADGTNGYLVDVDDLDALVERAGRVLSNPDGRAAFAAAGRAIAEAHDWAHAGRRLYDLVYRPLLAG